MDFDFLVVKRKNRKNVLIKSYLTVVKKVIKCYSKLMKENQTKMSIARVKFWQTKTPEEKSNHMRWMAKIRHAKLTPIERKNISDKMIVAKKVKKLLCL